MTAQESSEQVSYLGDEPAIAWLAEHGILVSPRYLKEMRHQGRGPQTVYQGRTALTTVPWLITWLQTHLLPKHPRTLAAERRGQQAEAGKVKSKRKQPPRPAAE